MGGKFKIVDVEGDRQRNTAGVDEFVYRDGPIPPGELTVTLRHEPNEANPFAVAVYLDDQRHVGWIGTTWSEDADELLWVQRLAAAGLRPRCEAWREIKRAAGHEYTYLFFLMPYDDDLDAVADELIAQHTGG